MISPRCQPWKVWSRKEVSERAQVIRDWMGWIWAKRKSWSAGCFCHGSVEHGMSPRLVLCGKSANFPLPWLWEEGYFLLVPVLLLWNEINQFDWFYWNHLETMTPKPKKGEDMDVVSIFLLFKPWIRWFQVLRFFAPIFANQPRTSEGWRNHRRVRLFFRGLGSSCSKLNRIHGITFFDQVFWCVLYCKRYGSWIVLGELMVFKHWFSRWRRVVFVEFGRVIQL